MRTGPISTPLDLFGDPHPVAFVTGSTAPRVGRAIATAFRQRGYRVVLHGNRSVADGEHLVEQWSRCGPPALALGGDLTSEGTIGHLFSQIHAAFGRLDVLVNSASIWESKRLEEVTADDVRRHFEINTLATFLCSKEAGAMMVNQEHGGAIVNLGDWSVARPYLDYAAYFPSKGAIGALTRDFAIELAARNPRIRVNAVLPGPVMLPPDLPQAEREAAIKGTLARREGNPQHVAEAVVFLAEHDYITGVCLPVDGGRTICPE